MTAAAVSAPSGTCVRPGVRTSTSTRAQPVAWTLSCTAWGTSPPGVGLAAVPVEGAMRSRPTRARTTGPRVVERRIVAAPAKGLVPLDQPRRDRVHGRCRTSDEARRPRAALFDRSLQGDLQRMFRNYEGCCEGGGRSSALELERDRFDGVALGIELQAAGHVEIVAVDVERPSPRLSRFSRCGSRRAAG